MTQQLAAAAALAGCGAVADTADVATADVTLPPPPLCLVIRSGLPSPLTSATASAWGLNPVAGRGTDG